MKKHKQIIGNYIFSSIKRQLDIICSEITGEKYIQVGNLHNKVDMIIDLSVKRHIASDH